MSTITNNISILNDSFISKDTYLLHQKEEKIKRLGLSLISQLAKPTPKRTFQELAKDLVQYDPGICFKSSGTSQKEIIDLIRKLHDKLLYPLIFKLRMYNMKFFRKKAF